MTKDDLSGLDDHLERTYPGNVPHSDKCDGCGGDFSERAIGRMNQEQIELLEASICPFCERILI